MMQKEVIPELNKKAFKCPHCGVLAQMSWEHYKGSDYIPQLRGYSFSVARCTSCGEVSIWNFNKMIDPNISNAPMAHIDMPQDIKSLYNEAKDIVNKSSKGACALLRLGLQNFCDLLVPGNKNINDKIAKLVENGLSPQLQQAFDLVRIVGNNAVHPGEINIDDNPDIALKLFELINFITDEMITKPNAIAQFYNNTMPQSSKDAIAKRDNKTKQGVNNA